MVTRQSKHEHWREDANAVCGWRSWGEHMLAAARKASQRSSACGCSHEQGTEARARIAEAAVRSDADAPEQAALICGDSA
jgi:hypothetical protein